MGCGASDIDPGITIFLANRSSDTSIYLTGEHIEGTAQFDTTRYDSYVELQVAYIELVGQVVYTTTDTYNDANISNGTEQTVHRVPFFSERQDFCFGLTPENPMTIPQFRKYSKSSFNFTLPIELPPSLPPIGGSYNPQPYVTYFIRVILESKDWDQISIHYSIPITVYPRVNIQNDLYRPIEIESENRQHVYLHATISQNVILPGMSVPIYYELHNPNRSTVDAIIVKLVQIRHMGTKGFYKLILEIEVPNVNHFTGEHLRNNFELTLPTVHLPPTSFYTFGNGSELTQCNPISVTYELIIEAKMSGSFSDFSLKCPIVVGTKVNDRSSPPSYASVTKLR